MKFVEIAYAQFMYLHTPPYRQDVTQGHFKRSLTDNNN